MNISAYCFLGVGPGPAGRSRHDRRLKCPVFAALAVGMLRWVSLPSEGRASVLIRSMGSSGHAALTYAIANRSALHQARAVGGDDCKVEGFNTAPPFRHFCPPRWCRRALAAVGTSVLLCLCNTNVHRPPGRGRRSVRAQESHRRSPNVRGRYDVCTASAPGGRSRHGTSKSGWTPAALAIGQPYCSTQSIRVANSGRMASTFGSWLAAPT